MSILQRLRFLLFSTPYVIVHRWNDEMWVRPVHFINKQPYVTEWGFDPASRVRLMPWGNLKGLETYYLRPKAWEPATPNMDYYFNPPAQ